MDAAAFSPDGRMLATAGGDEQVRAAGQERTIRLWDIGTGKETASLAVSGWRVWSLLFSPDGKTLTFDFVDATNLAAAQPGHMQRVIFTFVDANHHIEEWHFAAPGKEMIERFDLQKKS